MAVGKNGGQTGGASGHELYQKELKDGREKRSADLALDLARNLESAERLSRNIPKLEKLVTDLCGLTFEAISRIRQELQRAVELAAEFRETMAQASEAANEFKAMGGKIREMKSEGIGKADLILNMQQQLERCDDLFGQIGQVAENINTALEPAKDKARLDAWLRG